MSNISKVTEIISHCFYTISLLNHLRYLTTWASAV
ncbi:hypothetical protein A6R68_09458, partial [Neotoma lepida]